MNSILPVLLLILFFSFLPYNPLFAQLLPSELPSSASSTDYAICNFYNRRTFNDSVPTSKSDFWQYTNATCTFPTIYTTSTSATLNFVATSNASFWLDKKWDYGELFIAFLLVLNILLNIGLLVFNWFFEPVFKIRGGARG